MPPSFSPRLEECDIHTPLPSSCCRHCWIHCPLRSCLLSLHRPCCLNLMPVPRCCCWNSLSLSSWFVVVCRRLSSFVVVCRWCIHLSFLWARLRSFRSLLGCFVLMFLHAPLCCIPSSIRLRQFSEYSCLAVSLSNDMDPGHLAVNIHVPRTPLRHQNMSLHLQLLLVVLVHHHDFSFQTFCTDLGIVFVFGPQTSHDHLQVASFPSFSRCLPPTTIPVPHKEFPW